MLLRRAVVVAALLLLGLLLVPGAPASELDDRLGKLARDIARLVKDEKQTAVAVGDFSGPPAFASSSGPGIQARLVEQLKRVQLDNFKVDVKETAFLVIKGEYLLPTVKEREDELIVRLVLTIRNTEGKLVRELSEDLDYKGNDDIVRILGPNFNLEGHKKASAKDINEKMKKDLKKQPLNIDGTKVRTHKDSPFAVEVLARSKGESEFRVLRPADQDGKGKAFVDLKNGDEYTLRLHNGSHIEAAVAVTIDGIDALQFFEPAEGRPTSFLVNPSAHRDVEGWHRSNKELDRFLIGSYSESANAKFLNNPSTLGTITVCFHHSWEKDKTPDEYKGGRSFDLKGTGFGEKKKAETKTVPRTLGPLLSVITIRYNK